MRKNIILLVMALMGVATGLKAESISIDDFTITQGESMEVAVKLTNTSTNLTAFSFTLTLPSGLTLVDVKNTDRFSGGLTFGNPDNGIYIICGLDDTAENPITGNDGDLLILTVAAANTFKGGEGLIEEADFITSTRQHVRPDDSSFTVSYIKSAAAYPGDANEDESVDVTDIMTIANYLLGKENPVFNAVNADVNEDGDIDITDIMVIVNIILGKD